MGGCAGTPGNRHGRTGPYVHPTGARASVREQDDAAAIRTHLNSFSRTWFSFHGGIILTGAPGEGVGKSLTHPGPDGRERSAVGTEHSAPNRCWPSWQENSFRTRTLRMSEHKWWFFAQGRRGWIALALFLGWFLRDQLAGDSGSGVRFSCASIIHVMYPSRRNVHRGSGERDRENDRAYLCASVCEETRQIAQRYINVLTIKKKARNKSYTGIERELTRGKTYAFADRVYRKSNINVKPIKLRQA